MTWTYKNGVAVGILTFSVVLCFIANLDSLDTILTAIDELLVTRWLVKNVFQGVGEV